jgi:hypothetical protein
VAQISRQQRLRTQAESRQLMTRGGVAGAENDNTAWQGRHMTLVLCEHFSRIGSPLKGRTFAAGVK